MDEGILELFIVELHKIRETKIITIKRNSHWIISMEKTYERQDNKSFQHMLLARDHKDINNAVITILQKQ